ncbi:universal stress protein [Devosia sp. A16]|uniref:universal stress protein n=1 Tax=Devosia sp. A16 TaxID=1736675 RepID=UPI0018D15B80|nr:universal stress protein [Devosia sp. A16]
MNVDIDLFSPTLVGCAVGLAKRFDAGLIGISAAAPNVAAMGYEGAAAVGLLFEQEQRDIEGRLAQLEALFRKAVPAGIPAAWRGYVGQPNATVARIARCADLIITGSNFGGPTRSPNRSIDTGELLVKAGRPVIIAGVGLSEIRANRIVVGWKDSREARRAIVDALPLLLAATQVTIATIHEADLGEEKASLEDVVGWLRRHGVESRADTVPASGGGPAEALEALASKLEADLIVTGGYGHGRMREWLFGGMTRDLLSDRTVHRFMSN